MEKQTTKTTQNQNDFDFTFDEKHILAKGKSDKRILLIKRNLQNRRLIK